jgi:uncharacterized protein YqiB (DUF1249 family)
VGRRTLRLIWDGSCRYDFDVPLGVVLLGLCFRVDRGLMPFLSYVRERIDQPLSEHLQRLEVLRFTKGVVVQRWSIPGYRTCNSGVSIACSPMLSTSIFHPCCQCRICKSAVTNRCSRNYLRASHEMHETHARDM